MTESRKYSRRKFIGSALLILQGGLVVAESAGCRRSLDINNMSKQTIEESIAQYTAAWNEKGAENVKAALEKCWMADSTYADPNNAPVKGLDEIATLIGRAQTQSPGGKFSQISPPEFHHGSGTFKWRLTLQDGTERDGLDYFEYDSENHILRIVGFFQVLAAKF